MDRISRRDAKRTAESAEKNHEILVLLFFALSAFLFASLRETSCHFASLRETSCHFASLRETSCHLESIPSQPLSVSRHLELAEKGEKF
jgi:hypothetical protein